MNVNNLLKGQIEDKIKQCENNYMPVNTGFLDLHGQSLARTIVGKHPTGSNSFIFYGGYADAERVVLICLPDYARLENNNPLKLIRVSKAEGGRPLTHRDYLGSVIGLGIKREKIGDILVRKDGADIIVMKDIADFLMLNYGKAGKTYLSLEEKDVSELIVPIQETKIIKSSVASYRLDNIVASAFNLSRTKACEAIKSGLIFVNQIETEKNDYQIKEGDYITFRHHGKVKITETGGTSRKGRLYVTMEKY